MRLVQLSCLLLALLAPHAGAVAPSCEPGTFDPLGASPILCAEAEPVSGEVEAVGLVVTVTPHVCILACQPAGASAGADVVVADERGNAIPEGYAEVRASRFQEPGQFEPETCARSDGELAWGPFTQAFGDSECVDA